MDFINRDGATQAVSSCAVRHPLAISPRICAEVPHPGGGLRPDFRSKSVRIGFIYFITPILGRDVILVPRPRPHIRYKALPYPSSSARFEGIRLRVPSVKVPEYADLLGVGRPHGEMNAALPGELAEVCPHLLVGTAVRALRQQIQIVVAYPWSLH